MAAPDESLTVPVMLPVDCALRADNNKQCEQQREGKIWNFAKLCEHGILSKVKPDRSCAASFFTFESSVLRKDRWD